MIKTINKKTEFEELKEKDFFIACFYKKSSATGKAAINSLAEFSESNDDALIAAVNVEEIKDIHKDYGITVAPTVITVKKGFLVKKLEGVQSSKMYEKLLFDAPVKEGNTDKPVKKRVILYSTPTCPHCTTVKKHLRSNGIMFREIDLTKDQSAAQMLVKKSGTTGVPQTEIGGEIVVGANLPKINELLNIK